MSEDLGTRIQNFGSSMTRLGVTLTVLFTIPIVGVLFFGIAGLIVGLLIAVLYMAGRSQS